MRTILTTLAISLACGPVAFAQPATPPGHAHPPTTPAPSGAVSEALKVDTKGVTAKIKFEAVLGGFLTELNGKYKLRVTEINIAPGGYVGEHNHLGPGIRLMTSGRMDYLMPTQTIVYGPGDYFFETGDMSHKVVNNTESTCQHLLFEILPKDVVGPSLIPPKKRLWKVESK
jgi:quercetin dioxygenase-like cupin family protein